MAEMQDPSGREWPHDPDGEKGSEGGRKYDMAVLSKFTDEEEDYPLDVAEFVEEYGDYPVRINYRKVVSVADVFEGVAAEEIETKVEFHKSVGDAMRESGMWRFHPEA
jgi:hypothetical protein